ncbi:unnamed protein product [Staurois parvus]|uniref:Uncharacterized protein n=1 Tax=Staurois parvus TaxID=386267 RepID=A0ABN9CP46_9NEOB|nr:unnamed protein product [Staurois parvus]
MYSRLDYILVDNQLIERVAKVEIEAMTLSDHIPVKMKLGWGKRLTGGIGWKLNEALLLDQEIDQRIREEIERFFQENETGEVSVATVWESHKAYIRGILIASAAKKKRERREKLTGLLKEIFDLEQIHKNSIRKEITQKITK